MINPKNLKKSILDYAIRGELSAKFRTEFTNLSAYDEIAEFNAKISTLKSQREKLLSNLEKLLKIKPNSRHSERSEESHSLNLDFSPTAQNDSKDKIAQLKRIISKLKTKINSYKTITPLNTDGDFNPPFEIPNSWAWVKLGEICEIFGGKRLPQGKKLFLQNTGYKYLRVTDFENGKINLNSINFIDRETYKILQNYKVFGNDLCICIAGSLGKTCIVQKELKNSILTENAVRLQNIYTNLNQIFLYYFTLCIFFEMQVKEATKATAQPKLAIIRLKNFLIPLPPKAEQIYISQVLQNLLKECESYEVKALNLANLQTKFKSQIPKSILDYAIRGELSAKFRTEFTNLSAYDEINEFNAKISTLKSQREKLLSNLEKLLKTKPKNSDKIKHIIAKLKTKIKSYRTITPLNTDGDFNPPFEIPNSWAWVKLGEICEIKLGKTPPKENASYWTLDKNGYKWVSISDMLDKQTITKTEKFVTKKAKKEIYGNSIARKGTLLLSFKLTIGKTSILGFDGYHNEAIASIIPKMQDREIMKQFLLTFFEIFTKFSNSTTAIKGETLNKDKLNDLPIPLPPKNEQEFIASELEKLLSLCKNL